MSTGPLLYYIGTEDTLVPPTSVPVSYFSDDDDSNDTASKLNFYDVQRKRLYKFASTYFNNAAHPVTELVSAGSTTLTTAVKNTRLGFQDFEKMQVLNQWYKLSNDVNYLNKTKDIILRWSRVNYLPATPIPAGRGHPINQTHFAGLHWVLRDLAPSGTDLAFGGSDYTTYVKPWLERIRSATEAWIFPTETGGAPTFYGNHHTHHYMQYSMLLESLGDFTDLNTLWGEIDSHAAKNFPYGQSNDDDGVTYPKTVTIDGVNQGAKCFVITDKRATVYLPGTQFTVTGSTGNNGTYTVYNSYWTTNLTIVVNENIPSPVADGQIVETYWAGKHAMSRAATDPGESIDYIRRDALHYQNYNLQPWIDIAETARRNGQGGRYSTLLDNAFNFMWNTCFDNANTNTEFANSDDPFDQARWTGSHSEYLQPGCFWLPDEGSRTIMNYYNHRLKLTPGLTIRPDLIALAIRGDRISSDWPYWFRFALGL